MFFGAHVLTAALVEILVLAVAVAVAVSMTMRQFFAIYRLAGWLSVPSFSWVMFAALLNGAVVVMKERDEIAESSRRR